MDFSGKRVLITGGASGMGLEIARKFFSNNAEVLILDKNKEELNKVKAEFPNFVTVAADLINWDETRKAVESLGHIDHLVNNAALDVRQSFMDISPENIDFIFGVNFKAIVNVSQVVAKRMKEQENGGTIVNIGSIFGRFVVPDISIYCATKAAVIMFTKCMAVELAESKIRVNCVSPQYMVTGMTRDHIAENPEKFKTIIGRQAEKRFLKPQETADAVLFLSGPASAMIYGQDITVDGGYTLT